MAQKPRKKKKGQLQARSALGKIKAPYSLPPVQPVLVLLAVVAVSLAFVAIWQNSSNGAQPLMPQNQQPARSPNAPAALPSETPSLPLQIQNASEDGGGYSIVLNIGRANITSISVNGIPTNYSIHGNAQNIVRIPSQIDCSLGGGQASFEVNYTALGQNQSHDEQLDFSGCAYEGEGVEIPPPISCKVAGEPCSGADCCSGLVCSASGLCTAAAGGCALEGQPCGTEKCCNSIACDPGTHTCSQAAPGCAGLREDCATAADCCSRTPPFVCRDLICRFCSQENEMCTMDSDCCMNIQPMKCVSKVCVIS